MNPLQRPFWIDAVWLILLCGTLMLRFHFTGKPLFCYKVFRRLFWTVLAAFMGAIATFVFAACYLGNSSNVGFTMALVILIYTAYAWIFFILPLTLWFEDESRIYYFKFSIPLGIALSLIAYLLVCINDISSLPRLTWIFSSMSAFPILFGITVSVTLSALARFTGSQKSAEQDAAANP